MTRILLVDDDDLSRGAVHRMLERAGYSVHSTGQGSQAILRYKTDPVDLVITDLKMPGRLGGMDVVRAVKDIAPDTVVLVLTAYATLEVGIEAVKLGAYDVLTKPFNNDHVVLTVSRLASNAFLTVSTT